MKRFAYSLEKLLNLRKFAEDEAKIELGRRVGELSVIERRIRETAEERATASGSQYAPGNTVADFHYYMNYIIRLDAFAEKLVKDAAAAEMEVEKARENYIEKSRDRKALDKLKEKRYKEYRKEALYEEAKEQDDAARPNGRA
jgi:flagellar FliJ protein